MLQLREDLLNGIEVGEYFGRKRSLAELTATPNRDAA
jgi:hypothetical protein